MCDGCAHQRRVVLYFFCLPHCVSCGLEGAVFHRKMVAFMIPATVPQMEAVVGVVGTPGGGDRAKSEERRLPMHLPEPGRGPGRRANRPR
jgi:hypothetical protein